MQLALDFGAESLMQDLDAGYLMLGAAEVDA
jgi:hypothetical protein